MSELRSEIAERRLLSLFKLTFLAWKGLKHDDPFSGLRNPSLSPFSMEINIALGFGMLYVLLVLAAIIADLGLLPFRLLKIIVSILKEGNESCVTAQYSGQKVKRRGKTKPSKWKR